jgi:hypothetical protein
MTRHFPISAVAQALAIDKRGVKALIKSGVLPAADVAPPGSKYRKWRISQESLDLFLARRAHASPLVPIRRRRRRDDGVIHFNYD